MVETCIERFTVIDELSLVQQRWIEDRFGREPLTVGRMIELIYIADPQAEIRIRHYPSEIFGEYKISGIIMGRPISRVGVYLHYVIFHILKAVI